LSSLGGKFGSRKEDIYDFKFETTRAFNELKTKMIADTDDPAHDVLDAMSDAEQVTHIPQESGKASRLGCACAANFQARQEKAQQERNGEIAKLEKRIADYECKGPCTTFEEFTESEKKRRDCASSSAE
ncbi:hypothetical protein PF011_g33150, partial [Phytophthora fragariae]